MSGVVRDAEWLVKAGDEMSEDEDEDAEDETEDETEDEPEEEAAGDDETEGDEPEEDEMGNEVTKAVSLEDFENSLDRLLAKATSGDGPSRREELLSKAAAGDLSDDESDELHVILKGGDPQTGGELSKSLTEGLDNNAEVQNAINVTAFLQEQHLELTKALETVAEAVDGIARQQHEFNLVLAKALYDEGGLVKGMAEKLEVVAATPARPPKAAASTGQAQPLEKGFMGGAPGVEQLSKAQILDGLEGLHRESCDRGEEGMYKGLNLEREISKFEQMSELNPALMGEVQGYFRRQTAN